MIGKRLENVIKLLSKNPNSFASEIGVSATVIYNIIGGRKSKPSFDLLERIKRKYPHVNLNWLISQDGDPILGVAARAVSSNHDLSIQLEEVLSSTKQLEKLNDIRGKYINVLQNKVAKLEADLMKGNRSVRKFAK